MNAQILLPTLRAILAQPTAPFCEDAVRTEILVQLAQLPSVKASVDSFGNVLATYQRGDRKPRWLLNAHMDHPGYVGDEFLGGVPLEHLRSGAPTRSFGRFAMWDLPAFELKEGVIHSRACDNLIGCAAILATFQALERDETEASISAAFTCAEEVGLLGAVYLARAQSFAKDINVLSLETSAERLPAKMGAGVVVRVGDRTSVFEPKLTAELEELAKVADIPFQRCLMSGGTCEATAYQLYGYRVAGVCVPLGNYHNCAQDHQIAGEYVHLGDVVSMVRLCLAVATRAGAAGADRELRSQLETRLENALLRYFPRTATI